MNPAIEIRDISKSYGARTVLHRISLDVNAGEIFGLPGANGSGKSTLLRIVAGALRPSTGSFQLRAAMGYVAQRFAFYEDLLVEENITFHARCHGLSGKDLRRGVDTTIDRLSLTSRRREVTAHLSHGWKQRVAIAAALCHRPGILLMDEVTAGMDPESRQDLWALFRECAHSGVAILVSTHYMEDLAACDRSAYLREGRLESAVAA